MIHGDKPNVGKTFEQRLRHDLNNLAMVHGLSHVDVAFLANESRDALTRECMRANTKDGTVWADTLAHFELLSDECVRQWAEVLVGVYVTRCEGLTKLSA